MVGNLLIKKIVGPNICFLLVIGKDYNQIKWFALSISLDTSNDFVKPDTEIILVLSLFLHKMITSILI